MEAIQPCKGGGESTRDGGDPSGRKQAARDAGLSERQQKQAQRVNERVTVRSISRHPDSGSAQVDYRCPVSGFAAGRANPSRQLRSR